jgi:hypothetical protein
MTTLMQASHQWATRPDDERYTSLTDMAAHFESQRTLSREVVVPSSKLEAIPDADNKGLTLRGPNGHDYAPTHWAFGQLAQLAEAPAGYMRALPSPIAADCLNYGLRFKRDVEDVGVLLYKNGSPVVRAATGPRYGRIWNNDIVNALITRFGDGINGQFRVPGEFGKAVEVTKANTTLFAGDRDMFVFLADEEHRIEVPNRRDGQAGSMARGFFVWNSEVGSSTFGISTFLFDYVCCNRIVWGASDVNEIRIRHSASAPVKFIEEITPALINYSQSSTASITKAIADARATKVDKSGVDVNEFLAKRFSKALVPALTKIHELEEGRPIETLWDVTTAVTAYARNVGHQDRRVELERKAGEIMALAA